MPTKQNPALKRNCKLVAELMKLAGEPTRALILLHLDDGPMHHEQIAATISHIRPPAIQAHVSLMRRAGLVDGRREGRRLVFTLTKRGSLLLGAVRAIGVGE